MEEKKTLSSADSKYSQVWNFKTEFLCSYKQLSLQQYMILTSPAGQTISVHEKNYQVNMVKTSPVHLK